MSAIIPPGRDDLADDFSAIDGPVGAPAPQEQRPVANEDDIPDVDAEAAAEAAEEQANAIRPNAQANPHEFVTMENVIKSGPFVNLMVSIPITLSLVIALIVDAPRSCGDMEITPFTDEFNSSSDSSEDYGKPSPLKEWAITDVALTGLMFIVNAILHVYLSRIPL